MAARKKLKVKTKAKSVRKKTAAKKAIVKKDSAPLLIEIGTEELPPKSLKKLSNALTRSLTEQLIKAGLITEDAVAKSFATPRRLAAIFPKVLNKQPDQEIFKKGPAIKAAFDDAGKPTKAAEGFARGLKTTPDKLEQRDGNIGLLIKTRGCKAKDLIPEILELALKQLPIPKRMRWGDLDAEFVRPVHWLVLLHGKSVIKTELLSVKSGRKTYGHRFHHPGPISLVDASSYEKQLKKGYVIADFDKRRIEIDETVKKLAATKSGKVLRSLDFAEEVTGLVEKPYPILGEFDKAFLDVPQEALITTMEDNQKYFPVLNKKGKLLPYFITVSNIQSKKKAVVREGNERVLNARLADARFFWQQDKKSSLASRVGKLENLVFHNKLGSVADKCRRVSELAAGIAKETGAFAENINRASELAKADLMTGMVYEFPNLQGIMGRYYALHDGENAEVAAALEEQYLPRFAGDKLPELPTGLTLALADRLDTLAGIFAIGELPTGEKDPFALRRAALGVLRILIEKKININIMTQLRVAVSAYPDNFDASGVALNIYDFVMGRLPAYYQTQHEGISSDIFESVFVCRPNRPYDFHCRIEAVESFLGLKAAESLIAANKRISNILKKAGKGQWDKVKPDLLTDKNEQALFDRIVLVEKEVLPLLESQDYTKAMHVLAQLRPDVDLFFDKVMVNVEDEAIRENRLSLLYRLNKLFLHIADLSKLQG